MDVFEIVLGFGGLVFLAFGGLCFFAPEKARAMHLKCLPRMVRRGRCATPFQERIICRLAGAGLILLSVLLLKEVF